MTSPCRGYVARFYKALSQMLCPSIFMECTTLTASNVKIDRYCRLVNFSVLNMVYLPSDLTKIGYDPDSVFVEASTSVDYRAFYSFTKYAIGGQCFNKLLEIWTKPEEIPEPPFSYEGNDWPVHLMHSMVLRRILESRGILSRTSTPRALLVEEVSFVWDRKELWPQLPFSNFIKTSGKFIALDLLMPHGCVNWMSDGKIILDSLTNPTSLLVREAEADQLNQQKLKTYILILNG